MNHPPIDMGRLSVETEVECAGMIRISLKKLTFCLMGEGGRGNDFIQGLVRPHLEYEIGYFLV